MKYIKKLVGEKVYLSPINIEDAEKYVVWLNDFEVSDRLGRSNQILTVEQEKEWILENTKEPNYQLAIVLIEQDKLIGNIGFMGVDTINRRAELGIFIGEEQDRNKGYGTEAICLLLEYGFSYLNLSNIMLKAVSFNDRAIHTYEKVGFKEFGRRRKCCYTAGTYYDHVYMDIVKEEFKGEYIKNKTKM